MSPTEADGFTWKEFEEKEFGENDLFIPVWRRVELDLIIAGTTAILAYAYTLLLNRRFNWSPIGAARKLARPPL
jgi:hypothetical protein